MRIWKVVGLAGLLGAAAVGLTVGVKQLDRSRREFVDADTAEIRERLHARYAQIAPTDGTAEPAGAPADGGRRFWRSRPGWGGLRRIGRWRPFTRSGAVPA